MKIHEYQAKEILRKYNVPVPGGEMATTLEQADTAAKSLFAAGNKVVVVKAQIHAGGRGKGGGVKLAKTLGEADTAAKAILGMQLVTHQTGPQGQKVQRLLIEEGSAIERELYLGLVLDRASAKIVFMASQSGGMEIEEVAHATPELIYKEYIDPAVGFQPYQARKLAFKLGLKSTQINDAVKFMTGLYRAFVETDSTLMEINPFITTKDDKLLALDCKINFDDNAMFRHKDLKELRDMAEEDPLEVEASKYALNYIKLDGTIACMVNGAGLAMATMDIIQYAGGSAANFLDVGGGANQEQIENAFGILLSDPNVKAIFINIFGGILRVDVLATAVVAAAKKLNVAIPIILRLEGTNVEEGRKIISESGLKVQIGSTMKEAADLTVSAAKVSKSEAGMRFRTFGPFSVPLDVAEKSHELATLFEAQEVGLNEASGVYIFVDGTRNLPLYVGLTRQRTFGSRIAEHFNSPHNQELRQFFDASGAKASLFLIASTTSDGAFWKAAENDTGSEIHRLEQSLIAACLSVNANLFNKTIVSSDSKSSVPGYLTSNSDSKKDSPGFEALSKLLQPK